jgi:hypothetical protein
VLKSASGKHGVKKAAKRYLNSNKKTKDGVSGFNFEED